MTASFEVRAPAEESEGTRSRVLRWLKAPGDPVVRDEPLVELETDKVTVEVPACADGRLGEILKQEEEDVEPGDLLGRIVGAEDRVAPTSTTTASRGAPTPSAPGVTARDAETGATRSEEASGLLSPAVRRLLVEHKLRPDELSGTGTGGRITVDDVLSHVAGRSAASAPVAQRTPAPSPAPSSDDPGIRRVPHSALRRRIAEHMVTSLLHTAPHVTTVFEADFGAVLAHREHHRASFAARGVPLTLTAYVIAACVDALRAVPEANARWTEDALEIPSRIDIGVATALPDKGLVVPVIRDVGALDLDGIARALADITTRAREERLTPADMRGGTFTISNHGVSGSLLAAPIVINQPQSAILGVGRLERRPVVDDSAGVERIVVRPRCYVTLTIDHRVMDGHRANHFLEMLVQRLAAWPAAAD
jgi:2-oxoglutarate dehydrogenase E2 component (dihydrolipoamide succinyltransferase)